MSPVQCSSRRSRTLPCSSWLYSSQTPLDSYPQIVQSFPVFSVLQLRTILALNQTDFGKRIGVTKSTVINWELGHTNPGRSQRILLRNLARSHGLTKRANGPLPIVSYSLSKMKAYAGRPKDAGKDWKRMTLPERNSWWAHRTRYGMIRADIEAGRAIAAPKP